MSSQFSRRFVLIATLAAMTTTVASAGQSSVYQSGEGAASGYDVVAYFTENRPVEGSSDFTARHEGATWRFSSAANRDLFVADPAKYAPQYGGYCAYAVAQGSTASTVPEAWKIVDGKLYLNYSTGVQRRWESQQSGYIEPAITNWPSVLN